MKTLFNIFLWIHILSVAVMVILLLLQAGKTKRVVPRGLIHAGLTALVAGLILILIRSIQHHDHPAAYGNYSFGTLAAKFIILLVILAIAFVRGKA